MTMRGTLFVLLGALLLGAFVASPVMAAEPLSEEQLRKEPGYVEFGDIWKYSDGEEEVEVNITQPLLGVVGAFVEADDPELSALIRDLHLVKVNSFSFEAGSEDAVRNLMDKITEKLRGKAWDNIVKVRERNERVNVFVQFDQKGRSAAETFLTGLAVLVFEDGQATFVNVVGRFRLEDVARVGRHFELPHTEDWEKYNTRDKTGDEGGQ